MFELARAGDGDAGAVVEHIAARLGSAIATVCAILDPELVVLGGGIGSSPLLLSPVRGAAAALVPLTARIETSLLGDQAALRGAIAFALHAARSQLIPQGAPRDRRADPLDTHIGDARMAAIEIQDVSKRYRDGTVAVHDLSLRDRRRRVHGPRRPLGLRQDDAAADDRGAGGDQRRRRSRSATAWSTTSRPRTATSRWCSRTTRSIRT